MFGHAQRRRLRRVLEFGLRRAPFGLSSGSKTVESNFDIVWPATSSVESNLRIVIWNFSAVFGKANRFYLNQLEADFEGSLEYPNPGLDFLYGFR